MKIKNDEELRGFLKKTTWIKYHNWADAKEFWSNFWDNKYNKEKMSVEEAKELGFLKVFDEFWEEFYK